MPALPTFIDMETAAEVVRVLTRMLQAWQPRDSDGFRVHRDGEVLLGKLIAETKR